jgi:hypothetical protein
MPWPRWQRGLDTLDLFEAEEPFMSRGSNGIPTWAGTALSRPSRTPSWRSVAGSRGSRLFAARFSCREVGNPACSTINQPTNPSPRSSNACATGASSRSIESACPNPRAPNPSSASSTWLSPLPSSAPARTSPAAPVARSAATESSKSQLSTPTVSAKPSPPPNPP